MIRVPSIGEVILKKGEVKVAHYPNYLICWAAKNQIDKVMYFDYAQTATAIMFAQGRNKGSLTNKTKE